MVVISIKRLPRNVISIKRLPRKGCEMVRAVVSEKIDYRATVRCLVKTLRPMGLGCRAVEGDAQLECHKLNAHRCNHNVSSRKHCLVEDTPGVYNQRLTGDAVGATEFDCLLCNVVFGGRLSEQGTLDNPPYVLRRQVRRHPRTFQEPGCDTVDQDIGCEGDRQAFGEVV